MRRSIYYILDGQTPVPVGPDEWARWFEDSRFDDRRRVAETLLGDVRVSTVFLGLDHSYGDEPISIFETMVFGGNHDGGQWRYSTWDEALEGHERAVMIAMGAFRIINGPL